MNNSDTQRLAGVIELLLESSSRVNQAKPQPYWYPFGHGHIWGGRDY